MEGGTRVLPEDGIEPKAAGEGEAEEMAVAAGIGEEHACGHLVAASSNWRRHPASGGALVLATGSWVLEVHRNELPARWCLRPKRRAALTVVGARASAKRVQGGAMGAYKGRRSSWVAVGGR